MYNLSELVISINWIIIKVTCCIVPYLFLYGGKKMEKKKFDQIAYINDWSKKNMSSVSARYKKEFVEEFKQACKKLNVKQSDVIREMMQNIINQANEK